MFSGENGRKLTWLKLIKSILFQLVLNCPLNLRKQIGFEMTEHVSRVACWGELGSLPDSLD